MDDETAAIGFVAPVLWRHIGPYKKQLNIVENPSVGALAVPLAICSLIDSALNTVLQLAVIRNAKRVRVMCRVDHRSRLWLKIADNGIWYNTPAQVLLWESVSHGSLKVFQGADGEETIAQLVVQLPFY